jgi:hypothetical protein
LESLASALLLDAQDSNYLLTLVRSKPARRRTSSSPEQVSPSVQDLIDGWPLTPAYVHGSRSHSILAANPLAIVLCRFFAPGLNLLRAAFLEPEMHESYCDWDEMTAKAVPYLRSMVGTDVDDPQLISLIGELSVSSDRFRTLWARHDVKHRTSGPIRLLHPEVGLLELHYEKLLMAESGQTIVAYHAAPGSESHERLHLLGERAASPH